MAVTVLASGARKNLLDRVPEAERAVSDREGRRNLEPTLLDVDEKLTLALGALLHSGLETDELLLAPGSCADQDQHAFGGFFVRRAHFARIDEARRIFSSAPASPWPRTLARRTSTGPTPV